MKTFWISRHPGEVDGPFDVDTLERMREAGELPDSTQICPEGSETWYPLSQLEALAGEAPPTTAEAADSVVAQQNETALDGRTYSLENAFSIGWATFQKHYAILLGMIGTLFGAQILVNLLGFGADVILRPSTTFDAMNGGAGGVNFQTMFTAPSNFLDTVIGFLFVTPYVLGSAITVVRALRGETVSWSDSWCAFRNGNYGRILLIQLCWWGIGLLILLAMGILFGLPALLTAQFADADIAIGILVLGGFATWLTYMVCFIRMGYSQFMVLDPRAERPSMRDALRNSWRMTSGLSTFGSLFALGFLSIMIVASSILMCVVPFIFLGGPYVLAVLATAYALLYQGQARMKQEPTT